MGMTTVGIDITEEIKGDGKIKLTVEGWTNEEDDVSPSTRRFAAMLNEQMRMAIIAAKTTMNERV